VQILRRSDLHSFTQYTKTRVPDIVEALRQVRARGYALSNQEFELGLSSLACPIFAHDGLPVAAINVSVLEARMSAREIVRRFKDQLQATCDEISRELGSPRTLGD
jgi:IclR family pca regulon transcriptional regulator